MRFNLFTCAAAVALFAAQSDIKGVSALKLEETLSAEPAAEVGDFAQAEIENEDPQALAQAILGQAE